MDTNIGSKKELSVGEVAARSGLAISAIHFYEKRGLISSQRNNGNHRRYQRGVLRKLAVIKVAQQTGIPLEEIKRAMDKLSSKKTVTADDWNNLATYWQQELNQRIAQLTLLRDTLNGCTGCGCLSMTECQLFNPQDVVAQQGAGPYFLNPDVKLEFD